MKKRRRRPPGAEKRIILFRLAVIVAVPFAVFFLVDSWLRPPIENMAAYEAKVFAMKCINEAMAEEMGRQDVAYGDIVRVTQNNEGLVTSIQSDMQAINRLKVEVTRSILEELADKENQRLLIPLGTLMGNQLTSGRGPIVEIQVLPVGYVQTRIRNKFVSAGINQTLHQIMLETSVHINV
ncbi:MAG: sporulation protein YunB, partial [Oscillospiraceae bacterium]|nr:sporulation protein YunB [Oscillospiraceae bacterium]